MKSIIEETKESTQDDFKPVMQIISVKDIKDKKNMRHKLYISDGHHKIICIVRSDINTTAEGEYSNFDVVQFNQFSIKEVGKVKILIPKKDFKVLCRNVSDVLGKPKEYKKGSDQDDMDTEFEIPYQTNKVLEVKEEDEEIQLSEEDLEMKESPVKQKKVEELKKPSPAPSPPKERSPTPSPVREEIPEYEEPEEVDEPVEEGDDLDIYTPIDALSPINPDWIIKVRLSKKYPVKSWENNRGSGKLLNVELVDKHGSQIQATFFNKAVDKFDPLLEQDKVYLMSKGTVKVANQKFTSIKNDYCINFNPFSEIRITDEDNNITKQAFSFVNLKTVQTKGEGKAIDVVGVILSCSEPTSLSLKDGSQREKRDYVLADSSLEGGAKVTITLWGTPAKKFTFAPGTVVAFKGLKIKSFRGISLNGGDYTGVHEAKKLGLKEERALSSWYRNMKDKLDDSISLTNVETTENKTLSASVKLIKEFEDTIEKDLRNDPQLKYYINGHIEMIKNDPKMLYMACPQCKKKLTEESGGYNTWSCEK